MTGAQPPVSVTVAGSSDGAAVLTVRGEIDHLNANQVYEAIQQVLRSRRPRIVRVDLGMVTFLDSAAVGALVNGHRLAAAGDAHLVVSNASPFVRRQLAIAGVHELLLGGRADSWPHNFVPPR
jgi:anti-anti-sigma factor